MFNFGCIEFSIYFHVTNFWFKNSTILLLINLVPNFSYHILRCVQCSISTYISLDWIRCHIFICLYKTFFKCSDACQMCFFMTRRQMGLWYENHLSSHGWHMRRGTRLKKVKQLQQDGFQYHLVALTEEGAAAKFAKDWCKKKYLHVNSDSISSSCNHLKNCRSFLIKIQIAGKLKIVYVPMYFFRIFVLWISQRSNSSSFFFLTTLADQKTLKIRKI